MDIKKSFYSFLRFQLIPLPAVGLAFSILGGLLHFELVYFSFDIFSLLYDPLFISFLGIGSFLYIDRLYMKNYHCNCHKGYRKNIHYFSGYVTGMMAAVVFYLIPVASLFFVVFDSESNVPTLSQNIEFGFVEMPFFAALLIFGFISRLIVRDVFVSLSEDSGFLYNPKKSTIQQIKESIIEIRNIVLELKNKFSQIIALLTNLYESKFV